MWLPCCLRRVPAADTAILAVLNDLCVRRRGGPLRPFCVTAQGATRAEEISWRSVAQARGDRLGVCRHRRSFAWRCLGCVLLIRCGFVAAWAERAFAGCEWPASMARTDKRDDPGRTRRSTCRARLGRSFTGQRSRRPRCSSTPSASSFLFGARRRGCPAPGNISGLPSSRLA